MSVTQMSETAARGTEALHRMALDFASAVLSEQTPTAARRYLGLIDELGPEIHRPQEGVLEKALDLATTDMESAGLDRAAQVKNHSFFMQVARTYGLRDKVTYYDGKIAVLKGSCHR